MGDRGYTCGGQTAVDIYIAGIKMVIHVQCESEEKTSSECSVGQMRFGAYCYDQSWSKTVESQEKLCAEKGGHLWWPTDMYEIQAIKYFFP